MRRTVPSLLVTAALVFLMGTPAAAEPAVRIRGVVGDVPGQVRVLLSGTDLGGASLVPGSLAVTLDGRPAAFEVVAAGGKQAEVDRRVVLVIDTSGSMTGAGIEGAKTAARAFLATVPADVRVALVTFADTPRTAVPLTRDRPAVLAAVNSLVASGETSLYDGVLAGLKAVGGAGLRSMVVLSDGADTSSAQTLPPLLARVKAATTRLDAVSFRTDAATGAVLEQLALAGGGRVLSTTDGAGLGRAFKAAAQDLASDVVVTAQVPADLAGEQVIVQLTVDSAGRQLTDTVVTLMPSAAPQAAALPPGPRPVAAADSWLGSERSLNVAMATLFVGLLLMLVVALGAASSRSRAGARTRRLLSLYTLAGRPVRTEREGTALGDSDIARSAVELAGRVVQKRGSEERLALRLDRAGVPLRSSEWLVVQALSVMAGLLAGLIFGGLVVALLVASVAAVMPGVVLRIKGDRRRAAFLEAMPDSLQLLSGSLTAGFSLPQAIDAVSREGAQPLAGEFGRAVAEARLGVPVEDALDAVADRMDSEDFRWVVMAVRVQREVGGNLADVLATVAQTMRDRASLRRQVRALSAEGRLSAYVLIGLPILMTLYLALFRGDYLRPLYSEPLGIFMIAVAVVLMIVGSFWMKKLVTVEV